MDAKHFSRNRLLQFIEELERRDTPTFTVLPPFIAGIVTPTVVASADFNRDGFADVAVGDDGGVVRPPTIGIALGNGDGSFSVAPDLAHPLLTSPESIVAADFNRDGIPDLAVGSFDFETQTGSLLVFIGKGDGTFSGPTFQAPFPVIAIGVADFTGDTIPDLIAVNPSTVNLPGGYRVFAGAGNGTFALASAPQSVPIGVPRVATADFDKDGFQDFAALDSANKQLFVFFGDGTGNFVLPATGIVPLAGSPLDLIPGDFDGDGDTDVVVAEDVGIIFIGNLGSRQFDAAGVPIFTTPPSTSSYSRLATADVDRNGLPDVIAVHANEAAVFTSNGGGAFTQDPNSPYAIPGVTISTDVTVGDVNGDRVVDFVVARRSGDPSDGHVFLNLAPIPTVTQLSATPNPGAEGAPITLTATITFTGRPFPAVTAPSGIVRFDADGKLLGTANAINGVATFVTNFTAGPHAILAGYPGDARFEASASQPLTLLVNPAAPVPVLRTFQFEVTGLPTIPGLGADRVASGAFTLDGVPDILIGSGSGRPAQVTVIDGKSRQELFGEQPFGPEFTGGVLVAAGDIDGDHVADVAVAADIGGGPHVRIYLTRGDHLEPAVSFFALDSEFRGGLRIALGDLDGDGHADLVVAGGPGAGPRVAVYDGRTLRSGIAPERLFNDFFAIDPESRLGLFVAVGDLNGDGFAEIAVSSDMGGGPHIRVFDGESLLTGSPEPVANFFSGDPNSRGGVRIAIRNVSAGEGTEFITGDGPSVGSTVRIYSGFDVYANPTPAVLFENEVLPGFLGGVYVA